MIFNKMFDDIDETDIKNLLDNEIAERQNLEYKEKVWDHNDAGTREMLRDISSLANAFGGHVVIGIKANQDGVPIEIIDVVDAEKERDRIWSCCISCLEPRIPGFKIRTISTLEQKSLIIIFIPRSTRSPHMITFKGLNQFWIRHDRQKSPMSIEEIRESCVRVQNIHGDVEEFINKRKCQLSAIVGDEVVYAIGAIPLSVKTAIVDINDNILRDLLKTPPNQRQDGYNVTFRDSSVSRHRPLPTLYGLEIGRFNWRRAELRRNGYYEFTVNIENEAHLAKVVDYEKNQFVEYYSLPIVEYCVSYFRTLRKLREYIGVEEIFIGYIVVFNVKKYSFGKFRRDGTLSMSSGPNYYDKRHLEIGPMEIYDFTNPDSIAHEFLSRIWNAFGFESSDVPFFVEGVFNYEESQGRQ